MKVEGRDEVARLAESFNQAAARIEELVGAHKLLLANASHELRTPLARMRLGLELSKEQVDPQRQAELTKDIAELDAVDRRNPAREPARCDRRARGQRGHRSPGARGRGMRALRKLLARRHVGDGARRSAAAAADDPQSARERQAAWRAANRGRRASRGRASRAARARSGTRDRARRPRTAVRAVLPHGVAASGTGLGLGPGAADRPPAWRRRHLRAALLQRDLTAAR